MNISEDGLKLIKRHEGLRLNAYLDSVGVPTIGYGHVSGVFMGQEITELEADLFLRGDVKQAEDCVNDHVTVSISQPQFDALVSFVFNLGCGAFERSTLLRLLNEGDATGAAEQFGKWINAGGQKLPGLIKRRNDEMAMFLTDDGHTLA